MKVYFLDASSDIKKNIEDLASILGITISDDGFPVSIHSIQTGIQIHFFENGAEIGYEKKVHLYRAIGLFVENFLSKKNVSEQPSFNDLCVMYDNSRNAVLKVSSVKRLIRHLSLMGYTSLMLYTEDTYTMTKYPYFGYMRGRFSAEELMEIDDYAYRFGIEVIPCIQTLAHLEHALKWNAFSDIKDCNDILFVGEEKTYEFIESMFQTMRNCFRSKKIHIGMDEAPMLGNGKYFNKNGHKECWDIMLEHLQHVTKLAEKYNFKPIMWSDMFFKASFHGEYYAATSIENSHMPENIINTIPKSLEIVYWDYGNSYSAYKKMAKLHCEFKNPIWFAGGATKWAGYAPMNQFSIKTSRDALKACHETGIKKVIVTAWGDNGAECSNMAVFPTLQMYAEDCYEGNNSDNFISNRFRTCMNASYEDFLMLDIINFTPGNPAPGCGSRNPSKYLLHQDVMIGIFDKHLDPATFPKFFAQCSDNLCEAAKRNQEWSILFETMAALANVLTLKADVGIRLKNAYDTSDRKEMLKIQMITLPQIINKVEHFLDVYRKQWLDENKIFGLEVIEIRLGGLIQRIKTAILRINEYLSGSINLLPELEEERLFYDCNSDHGRNLNLGIVLWGRIATCNPLDDI